MYIIIEWQHNALERSCKVPFSDICIIYYMYINNASIVSYFKSFPFDLCCGEACITNYPAAVHVVVVLFPSKQEKKVRWNHYCL